MAYIHCMFRNILGYDPLLVYIYIYTYINNVLCKLCVCVMIFVVSIQTDH